MSSRQEQKERRRKEREERERAERQAAQRKQLAQWAGGAVIVVAVIVGIVLAASGGGGGGTAGDAESTAPNPLAIPALRQTSLANAVKAAGCAFREFDEEGREHVTQALTAKDFKTNPPTSGNHNPVPSGDGFYSKVNTPNVKNSVHALEHGRIEFQYNPKLSLTWQRKLRSLYNENGAYHTLMFQNNTGMKYAVAATAWTRYVVCNTMNDKVFDAFRDFRSQFTDQGPEQVP